MFKRLRLENGLTQEQVAVKIGVDQSAVSGWEVGAAFPKPIHLMRLANIYNVSVAVFYEHLEEEEE